MKRRVVTKTRTKTTKNIMLGSSVVREYDLKHRHARRIERMIIAKVLVAFLYRLYLQQVMKTASEYNASISWPTCLAY